MTPHKELQMRLMGLTPQGQTPLYQGRVTSVEGEVCTVEVDSLEIPDVRLRATTASSSGACLLIPRIGSGVIVGSLSGDLSTLAVLSVDELERVELHGKVILNAGRNGGLVNIDALTAKLNEVIQQLNTHTHTSAAAGSPTTPPLKPINPLKASDYEDKQVTH